MLACLPACLCYSISASYTKRYAGGLPSLVTATCSQLGATLGLALLAVGVLCTGVALILYFRLIENVGPARSLTVTFVVPVFAVIYGVIFLGESVSMWMLLCGAIIVCGTALSMGLLRAKGSS